MGPGSSNGKSPPETSVWEPGAREASKEAEDSRRPGWGGIRRAHAPCDIPTRLICWPCQRFPSFRISEINPFSNDTRPGPAVLLATDAFAARGGTAT